jgi:hypothetical protein
VVVLEVKNHTDISSADLRRAFRRAEYYRDAVNADDALIVLPDSVDVAIPHGAATVSSVTQALVASPSRGVQTARASRRKAAPKATLFAAMPFAEKYDDVFYLGIAQAAKAINATAIRIDKEEFNGDIIEKIHKAIEASVIVVADISEAKPNVLFEAGYAHALPRPCVHICSTPLKKLPFDVSHWSTLEYKLGQVHKLRQALSKRLTMTFRAPIA